MLGQPIHPWCSILRSESHATPHDVLNGISSRALTIAYSAVVAAFIGRRNQTLIDILAQHHSHCATRKAADHTNVRQSKEVSHFMCHRILLSGNDGSGLIN